MSTEIILACREVRCAWDVMGAGWFVVRDYRGRWVWERKAPCLRGCGSFRRERVKPDGTFDRIGSPVYYRTDEWRSFVGFYLSAARAERIRQQGRLPVITENEERPPKELESAPPDATVTELRSVPLSASE